MTKVYAKGRDIGFLDLDMRLVYDIMNLFVEEMPLYRYIDMRDLLIVLKRKGYGKHKIRMTVKVMVDNKILSKSRKAGVTSFLIRYKRARNNTWSWVYKLKNRGEMLHDMMKNIANPQISNPTYMEVKREKEEKFSGLPYRKTG